MAWLHLSVMLGWHITVYRQEANSDSPVSFEAPTGATLAVWQADITGLNWIDALVRKGLAVSLGGNGYPTEYTATLEHIQGILLDGPPHANTTWLYEPGDILTEKWLGRTTVYHQVLSECDPEEWVVIQAWDES